MREGQEAPSSSDMDIKTKDLGEALERPLQKAKRLTGGKKAPRKGGVRTSRGGRSKELRKKGETGKLPAKRKESGDPQEIIDLATRQMESFGTEWHELLDQELTILQQSFLVAYLAKRSLQGAAEIVGCTQAAHWVWRKTSERYREAWQMTREIVVASFVEQYEDQVVNGFERRVFGVDEDGNEQLVSVERKVDPRAWEKLLAALSPEFEKAQTGGKAQVTVNIAVIRTNE